MKKVQDFKLKHGGVRGEAREQANMARASTRGFDPRGARTYRGLLAAHNVIENEAMADVQALFAGSAPWNDLMAPQREAGPCPGEHLVSACAPKLAQG